MTGLPRLSTEEQDMLDGYLDGRQPDSPEPSENRSASYRHGFANGRDDLSRKPRATAAMLRVAGRAAIREDRER